MTLEDFRFIDTGIKASEDVMEIFDGIFGQMGDGIWKESNRMNGYVDTCDLIEKDGNVKLKIDNHKEKFNPLLCRWYKNRYYGKTEKTILKYFATKIKQIVDEEMKDYFYNTKVSTLSDDVKIFYLNDVKLGTIREVRKQLLAKARNCPD